MDKLLIGSHVSFNKDNQLLGSVLEAISYGANTLMLYTGAPQNTVRVPINEDLTNSAKVLMKENNINIEDIVCHAPYIINLANNKNFDFNVKFLKEEINRVDKLGITKLVLHPGSYVDVGLEKGIKNIIDSLNIVLNNNSNVIICLETMAGKGTEIGRNIEELKEIIDKVNYKEKIGICLDTCHLNDSGYDMSDFNSFINLFDKIIGIDKIKVIHVNDSKNPMGSSKDRHENIGFGTIGFNNLLKIIYDKRFKKVPKILETPYIEKHPPYKQEINMILEKKFNNNLKDDILE